MTRLTILGGCLGRYIHFIAGVSERSCNNQKTPPYRSDLNFATLRTPGQPVFGLARRVNPCGQTDDEGKPRVNPKLPHTGLTLISRRSEPRGRRRSVHLHIVRCSRVCPRRRFGHTSQFLWMDLNGGRGRLGSVRLMVYDYDYSYDSVDSDGEGWPLKVPYTAAK